MSFDGRPLLPEKPEGAFRVLHTADWHLGKMLGSLSRLEEQRRFLTWLEGVILSGRVDALIVAGDIFDSATPPQAAVRLYYDFLAGLHAKSSCSVVVTAGNHDSPAQLAAPSDLLRVVNVRVSAQLPLTDGGDFDPDALLIPLPSADAPRLLVAALPFLRERDVRTGEAGETAEQIREALQRGIAQRYREAAAAAQAWRLSADRAGVALLATGHLTALGSKGSESEREIHVGGLGAVGAEAFPEVFSYVALGHLHRPQAVGGREHLRYSGSPMALSFSEAEDAKEVRFLDFIGDRLAAQHGIALPVWRALVRLQVPQGNLASVLRAVPVAVSELPVWVEITVTNANRTEDLFATVQALTKDWQGAEVIRVTAEYQSTAPRLEANAETRDDLLDDPTAVFALRLEQEKLEPEVRAAVELAFEELRSRLAEMEPS